MPPGRFCRIYCNIPAQFGCFICFVLVLVLAARPTADYFLTRKRQIIAMTVSYWNFFLDDFLCLSLLRYAALCCGLRGVGLGDGAYLGLGLCLWLVGDRNIKLHDWLWWKETGHRNVFIDPFFSFCTPRLSINIYCYRITVRPWVFFWFLTKPFPLFQEQAELLPSLQVQLVCSVSHPVPALRPQRPSLAGLVLPGQGGRLVLPAGQAAVLPGPLRARLRRMDQQTAGGEKLWGGGGDGQLWGKHPHGIRQQ